MNDDDCGNIKEIQRSKDDGFMEKLIFCCLLWINCWMISFMNFSNVTFLFNERSIVQVSLIQIVVKECEGGILQERSVAA